MQRLGREKDRRGREAGERGSRERGWADTRSARFSREWVENYSYGVDNNGLPNGVSVKEMAKPTGTVVKDNYQGVIWSGVSRKSSSADAASNPAGRLQSAKAGYR